jgi:hypothetical protein
MKFSRILAVGLCFFLFHAAKASSILCVNLNSTNPSPPYADWNTAATNIQDAVDVANAGDFVVVSNGVYSFGNRQISNSLNRVVVTNAITLQSVNGRDTTIIDGGKSERCIYLSGGAKLDGFTLINGAAGNKEGGGAFCESTNALIVNCLIVSNSSAYGGGVIYGCLSNCNISFNNSSGSGGGAESCLLNNCSLSNNLAGLFGGGVSGLSTLNNCILFGNVAQNGGGGAYVSTLNNCLVINNKSFSSTSASGTQGCADNNCTICSNAFPFAVGVEVFPSAVLTNTLNNCIIYYNTLPVSGQSNILFHCCFDKVGFYGGQNGFTNAPLFVNLPGGDYRLQSNSPCINSGKNSSMTSSLDLDGNPRTVGGTVDIGAFEFQSPTSVLSYAWAQKFNITTDGSADFLDSDGDGMNNWQECVAQTNPTNSAAFLQMYWPSNGVSGVTLTWQGVSNLTYFLERSTDVMAQTSFSTIRSNINGRAPLTSFTDVSATNAATYFYRVGVQ